MTKRIVHRGKGYSPLPIRDGLNATRARVPEGPVSAWDFVWHLIYTQRHRGPDDNEAALEARFAAGEVVLADATPLSPSSILSAETDVYFYRTPAPEVPVPYEIPILFEDERILVADKPPFMATMPRARHIVETATVRLRRATGNNELAPAHRLDRLTAGVLLFTKEQRYRGAYQTMFAERNVSKTYEAIAADIGLSAPLRWEDRIEKVPGEIQARFAEGQVNAITDVVAIEPIPDASYYHDLHGIDHALARYTLKPLTGKTHQLRMHMWKAGAPILGDPVYPVIFPADAEDMNIPMHLLAKHLSFTDPIDGSARSFSSLQ